ncbi:MAG: hypothetical protein IT204_14115 [Fimbriimonadaceae bacterium]|nr:hypothetical protein [Fimbriimonadaceae bacterium]
MRVCCWLWVLGLVTAAGAMEALSDEEAGKVRGSTCMVVNTSRLSYRSACQFAELPCLEAEDCFAGTIISWWQGGDPLVAFVNAGTLACWSTEGEDCDELLTARHFRLVEQYEIGDCVGDGQLGLDQTCESQSRPCMQLQAFFDDECTEHAGYVYARKCGCTRGPGGGVVDVLELAASE